MSANDNNQPEDVIVEKPPQGDVASILIQRSLADGDQEIKLQSNLLPQMQFELLLQTLSALHQRQIMITNEAVKRTILTPGAVPPGLIEKLRKG